MAQDITIGQPVRFAELVALTIFVVGDLLRCGAWL
jgi:hypothetical protein